MTDHTPAPETPALIPAQLDEIELKWRKPWDSQEMQWVWEKIPALVAAAREVERLREEYAWARQRAEEAHAGRERISHAASSLAEQSRAKLDAARTEATRLREAVGVLLEQAPAEYPARPATAHLYPEDIDIPALERIACQQTGYVWAQKIRAVLEATSPAAVSVPLAISGKSDGNFAFLAGWQPIETAPRDGGFVLGYAADGVTHTLYWAGEAATWVVVGGREYIPTHWMPLPPPPAEGGQP